MALGGPLVCAISNPAKRTVLADSVGFARTATEPVATGYFNVGPFRGSQQSRLVENGPCQQAAFQHRFAEDAASQKLFFGEVPRFGMSEATGRRLPACRSICVERDWHADRWRRRVRTLLEQGLTPGA